MSIDHISMKLAVDISRVMRCCRCKSAEGLRSRLAGLMLGEARCGALTLVIISGVGEAVTKELAVILNLDKQRNYLCYSMYIFVDFSLI